MEHETGCFWHFLSFLQGHVHTHTQTHMSLFWFVNAKQHLSVDSTQQGQDTVLGKLLLIQTLQNDPRNKKELSGKTVNV